MIIRTFTLLFYVIASNQFTISQGKSLSNHGTNTAQRLIALTTENLASSKSDTLSNRLTFFTLTLQKKQISLSDWIMAQHSKSMKIIK